jgi:hypothetical protein
MNQANGLLDGSTDNDFDVAMGMLDRVVRPRMSQWMITGSIAVAL